MAIVRELITRFGFNVDTTSQARVEGSIQRISGLLSGIAAFASLRALANVADSMQSLEARIGMLPQTVGKVGDAFDEVSRNASANRQSIDAYGAFYTKVGNAAKGLIKDQGQLLQVTNTISQALVVGGATTQEAQSAMLQFGQALGSGVLQGEEFRAMAEAAPQYLDALSEAMNIPRENLKKMASEGKLTSKAVIEATLKMSSMFEEKFKQMPMTIGQATTVMGNRFKTMIAGMNRETQIVTDIANFLLSAFDRIEGGFNTVVDSVGGLRNALKLLGIAAAAILGPMALGGLISIMAAILSPAGLVIGALILVGLVIDDIITYLDGGQSTFGSFIEWMKSGSAGAAILSGALIAVAAAITGYLGAALLGLSAKFLSTIALSYALSGGLLPLIGNLAILAGQSIATGVSMAAGWLMALGPIGLVIAAIAALSAGLVYVYSNWDKIKGFFGFNTPNVAPASVATAGKAGNVVNSNQTVNLTVPAGTPESQQKFLKDAASAAFQNNGLDKVTRDLAMVG